MEVDLAYGFELARKNKLKSDVLNIEYENTVPWSIAIAEVLNAEFIKEFETLGYDGCKTKLIRCEEFEPDNSNSTGLNIGLFLPFGGKLVISPDVVDNHKKVMAQVYTESFTNTDSFQALHYCAVLSERDKEKIASMYKMNVKDIGRMAITKLAARLMVIHDGFRIKEDLCFFGVEVLGKYYNKELKSKQDIKIGRYYKGIEKASAEMSKGTEATKEFLIALNKDLSLEECKTCILDDGSILFVDRDTRELDIG